VVHNIFYFLAKMDYHTDSDMESDSIVDTPQESSASTSRTQKPKKWAYTHKYQTAWESNSKFSSWISVSKKEKNTLLL